jgi:hypothetical protein
MLKIFLAQIVGTGRAVPKTSRVTWGMTRHVLTAFTALFLGASFSPAHADAPPVPGVLPAGVLPNEILFHCSFENTLQPEHHDGEGAAQASVPPIFVSGKKGRAVLTSHVRSVSYALENNLRFQEGTVSLWISPLNWHRSDGNFYHFFTVPDLATPEDNATGTARPFSFMLYKFGEWPDVLAYGMGGELSAGTMLRVPMDETWRAGSWHHLAFVWNEDGAALYVDGHAQTMRYAAPAPLKLSAKEFRVGGPYFVKNLFFTAVDELTIYKRVLSKTEVENLFRAQSGA